MTMRTPRPAARVAPSVRFSLAVAMAALLTTLGAFAGCGLATGGIPSEQDAGSACGSSAQCDDDNPCTTDVCSSQGVCTNTAVTDGPAPAASQPRGNCKQVLCTKGEPNTVEDDSNTPSSSDMCMTGSCTGGTPSTSPQPDKTQCTVAGAPGTCLSGVCNVDCKTATDCISKGPCQTPSCDGASGTCTYTPVPDGTPTPDFAQVTGDCQIEICVGGASMSTADPSDIPTIPAALAGCADAQCDNGTPTFPLHGTDSQCSTWMGSMAGFCNATGNCSQCTQDSECAGTGISNDCQKPGCNLATSVCQQVFTPANTPTMGNPPQVSGNCMQVVCDGAGSSMSITDPTNTPPNTNQGCEIGICTGSTPGMMAAPNAKGCGSGLACLNGNCAGCTTNTQCQPPQNGFCNMGAATCGCTPFTCQTTAPPTTCGSNIPDGCGGVLSCDNGVKDGNETDTDCGGGSSASGTCASRCAQGKHCGATSDCQSGLTCTDGVCCNSACTGTACEACSAQKKGQGADGVCGAVKAGATDPRGICTSSLVATCGDMASTCNGSGACALWPSTAVCQSASCAGNILTKAENCNGTGSCVAPVPATQNCMTYMCMGGACLTSCTGDANCASGNYCSGGACVPKLGAGGSCTGNNQCANPNVCSNGICCNSTCTGACQSCNGTLTGGANGTCATVMTGTTDPSGSCAMTAQSTCGTNGKCVGGGSNGCQKWPSGTACSSVAGCSGNMETIDTTCDGNGSCSQSAMMMSCPNNASCVSNACATTCTAGQTTGCASGFYCATANSCQAQEGTGSCSVNAECTSGVCAGNCCSSATCMTSGMCGATCDSGGACNYPTTACTNVCSGGNITLGTCNGGSCQQGSSNPCSGGFLCSSSSTCANSCTGVGSTTTCQNNYYCDGANCQAQLGLGMGCTQNYQCLHGMCLGTSLCN